MGQIDKLTIVVVEERALIRECFTQCLGKATGHDIIAVATVEQCERLAQTCNPSVFVLNQPSDRQMHASVAEFVAQCGPVPVVLISHGEDLDTIVGALADGIKGYIPTSMSLDSAAAAIKFVATGGTFVPAASLLVAVKQRKQGAPSSVGQEHLLFTARQAAVIEAIRKGKANKMIAYELNMCESTVKVHVRKIMKKLQATNRTQVAFIAHEFMKQKSQEGVT